MPVTDRAEALAALAALGVKDTGANAPASDTAVKRTGEEVYAGGEVERILVRDAHLVYREDGNPVHAFAAVGDTVLITAHQAKRLDNLGVTIETDATAEELADAADDDGTPTDEQLATYSAADLVAYVTQNPDERARVRTIEQARDEDKQRKTVLAATDPELDPDAAGQ